MERLVHLPHGRNTAEGEMATEPRSFEEFFLAERDRLFHTFCLIIGNRHEAEDLAQDAFVRVLERWDSVGAMADPAGYLHRTAMNLFRNRYRRAMRSVKRMIGAVPPPDVYEAVDARDAMDAALAPLSPRQRAAIVLTDGLGYTAEEAGRLLGVKGSTVRALHMQARSALKGTRRPADV